MRWLLDPETFPVWMAPDPLPMHINTEQRLPVLRHSLQTLVRRHRFAVDVEEWLKSNVGCVDSDILQEKEEAIHPFLARRRMLQKFYSSQKMKRKTA